MTHEPPRRPSAGRLASLLTAAPLLAALAPAAGLAANPATTTVITTAGQLIGGPAATARAGQGDVLLQNDRIRVIIRGPGRTVSAAMFGGHIIDADLRRTDGTGRDQFGQLSTFINLSHTLNATSVTPITSGLSSGYAGVRACGSSDLFDFVDLENAISLIPPFLKMIPYDFDSPLPLTLCNVFTLGPDDAFVKIETEMTDIAGENQWVTVGDLFDSGSDVELWLKNELGSAYGKAQSRFTWGGFGTQPFGYVELMGLFGNEVSYGYTTTYDDGEPTSLVATVAGVTVSAVGSTSLLGTLRGSKLETLRVPANGNRKYTRYFFVGRDIAAVTREAWRREGITTTAVTGTVVEATTGRKLARSRVTVLKDGNLAKPVTQFYTDANGAFTGALPPGSYGLIAAQGFDRLRMERAPLLTPQMITVPSSGTLTTTVTLPTTATLRLTVRDGLDLSGQTTLPARVSFYDPNYAPPASGGKVPEQVIDPLSLVMDQTDDPLRPGLVKEVMVAQSPVDIPVPPGTWDVVITRGPEYSRSQTRKTFTGNQTTTLTVSLTHVVDTDGWLSADLHVHAMNSPDSPIDNGDRVMSFAADGVDMLVSTDHDFITDYQPLIDSLGLDDRLTSLPGLEMTTFAVGHFNTWPMPVDATHRIGGALDWADNDYVCDIDQDETLPSEADNLSPVEFLEALDECYAGDQLRMVNHARGELQGYFTDIGLDLSQVGATDETAADPATFRMDSEADLFDPASFQAMEVLNGYGFGTMPTLLNDAFALFNLGFPKALVAVSDTHYMTKQRSGDDRTWIKFDVDDPAMLNQDATLSDQFVESLGARAATAGSGPFLTVEVQEVGGSTWAGPGETLSAADGAVNVHIKVQHPTWMSFDTIGLFVNTPVQATWETSSIPSLADLGPQKVYSLPNAAFTRREVAVTSLESGATRIEYEGTVELSLTKDSWLVAAVWGGTVDLYKTSGDIMQSAAFTSPVLIDMDGVEGWLPPCGAYSPGKSCSLITAPSGSWEDRAREENHHTEWVEDLWRIVQIEAAGAEPTR